MSAAAARTNPFPGLRPFTQEEDYLFFGREEQTIELLQRLASHRFVAVVGTSGSGKSSLVRCGLLSELLGGRMLEAGAAWEIAVTHPGGNPLVLLTDALLEADLYDRDEEHARENLLATLSRSHFGLVEAVKQAGLAEGTNFLLVVDQFEEIFRFHEAGQTQQEVANEFVSLLLQAASQKDVPIYVVLTMRSDFIGECGQFEGLAEMVNQGEFLIPRLNREQYKRVIEGPIKVAGGQIAPRLLQRLLNDLGQQADQLPCLQHALMRTWNVWAETGDHDALDLDDYQRVGKMSQALDLHADEIFESLASERERDLCRGLFQALTVEESNSRGIRRPQRLGRLCQILEVPAAELLPIIDAYRQRGVTFLMPSPEVELTGQTIIDISHESLMRVWTRLRQWVEEETQAAGIYHRLSESAALHEQGKAGLYRDPELGIALAWRESNRPNAAWAERYRPGFATAIGFLEASQRASVAEEQAHEAARQRELTQAQQLAEAQQLRLEQQLRATRKLRRLMAGVAVVAVIAAVACAAALLARHEAAKLARLAAREAENARNNALRVESQKAEVESSLAKAEAAEQVARAAEESGRKLLYTTDMRLAPFVWNDDRTTADQLRLLLAKHVPDDRAGRGPNSGATAEKPDLRGFEWYYYQHLLRNSAGAFSGHSVAVIDSALARDGRLVTLDEHAQVRRWETGTFEEDRAGRRDLAGDTSTHTCVLSPDGRLVALADGDKVRLLDASTGSETFKLASAGVSFRALAFSGDGETLAVVDDKVRWWRTRSGELIAAAEHKQGRVEGLALSPDGRTLAVVGHGGTGDHLSVFRLDAGTKTVASLASNVDARHGTLNASAMSPDGQRLAVGAKLAGTLFVVDTATGQTVAEHGSAHASPCTAMAFSDDGGRLATADAEGTVKVWTEVPKLNSKSAAALTLKGHQGTVRFVRFASDGKRLVTTSADKTCRIWNLEGAGPAIQTVEGVDDGIFTAFSRDGVLIAVADHENRDVHLWDAASGRRVRTLPTEGAARPRSIAFSPADDRLLAIGYSGKPDVSYVSLWDIDAGAELARWPGSSDLPGIFGDETTGAVDALAFSPDGKYLVAGFGSRNFFLGGKAPRPLKVWDVATRRLVRRLDGHQNFCVALAFSSDGTLLASASRDGTAILWSTRTWKAIQTLRNPERDSSFGGPSLAAPVEGVAFSPDGKLVSLASHGGTVSLWDVADGTLREKLKGHSSAVNTVMFSPDGRTLASGSNDGTIRLWNVETRRELMQLDSGNAIPRQVHSLAFSPDGRQLAAACDKALVWSSEPLLWNDPDRAAERLQGLLRSKADFRSRIRMLSENLRLHAALEKLDPKGPCVAAALAAAQANWHASRREWPEAVAAFDRLAAADPSAPEAWLRTPGLLRLATALLSQDRPRDAAALLHGGAGRRLADGLPAAVDRVSVGVTSSVADGEARVAEVLPGSPASRSGLRPDDTILKVNDTDLSRENSSQLTELLAGEAGTKVRLTVRRAGAERPAVIELTREQFVNDGGTGELLHPLRAALNERLAREPRHPGLLELRAELAGQWSGWDAQAADYTAAMDALAEQKSEVAAADVQRLYRRRGDAYAKLKKWPEAVADYAHLATDTMAVEESLANQATARAEAILSAPWTVLKPVEAKSELGAVLSVLPDDSILASGANAPDDRYRIVLTMPADFELAAVRLEMLTHPSLPQNGPGRHPTGNFAQWSWTVTAEPPGQTEAITLKFDRAWADQEFQYPVRPDGHLNLFNGGEGRNSTAIWGMSEPVSMPAGTKLIVAMKLKSDDNKAPESLGHFRLSVASDPSVIQRAPKYLAVAKLTDPWQKLTAAYRLDGKKQAIDQLVERHPKWAGRIGDAYLQGEDANPSRAVEIYTRGIATKTTDADLLSKRARAYESLNNWDAALADWARAATGDPNAAELFAGLGRRLVQYSQASLAKGPLARSQALYEDALKADSGNTELATELAQLLFDKDGYATASWTILKPTELKSAGGATLSLLADGSVLASGKNPQADAYTVVAPTNLAQVSAIRLEALTDESLPIRGPGRAESRLRGIFHMVDFRVTAQVDGMPPRPFGFSRLAADYPTSGLSAMDWNITNGASRPHTAIYLVDTPVVCGDGARLEFQMRFYGTTDWPLQNLGRFRLSVCADPEAFAREELRLAGMKLADPWSKLAVAYALNGYHEEASRYFIRSLELADDYGARRPILELAARFDDVWRRLGEQRPNDFELQLARARHLAKRGHAALDAGQTTAALTELKHARAIFDRVVSSGTRWSVVKPVEMHTESGTALQLQPDGSVFVPKGSPTDTYTLAFDTGGRALKGLRLEALADPRLPSGGPGWFHDGAFLLSELTLQAAPAESPDRSRSIRLRNAFADCGEQSAEGWQARDALDGNSWSAWGVAPQFGDDHVAVFDTADGVSDGHAIRLTARLEQNFPGGVYVLGRFRLSTTDDAATLASTRLRLDLKDNELAACYVALGKAHERQGQRDEAINTMLQALRLDKQSSGGDERRTGRRLGAQGNSGMAAWLESGVLIDEVLDALQARQPEVYASMLPAAVTAAEEHGHVVAARKLYERLDRLQPTNKVWKQRAAQLRPGTLALWSFDSGQLNWKPAGGCELSVKDGVLTARTTGGDPRFQTQVSGPSGRKAVILRYRTDEAFTLQVFWADAAGGPDDSRHRDFPIPASPGAWREITLPFTSKAAQTLLRLDPNTRREHPLEIDSIALRHLEPADAWSEAEDYAARKAMLEDGSLDDGSLAALREAHPDDPQLLLAQARRLAEKGNSALAGDRLAAALADLERAREIFDRLASRESHWTVAKPVEMHTDSGVALDLQPDGSVLVHRPLRNDTISLTFETDGQAIQGLRLEALADPRLPSGGPGWANEGNFVLTDLSLQAATAANPDDVRSIGLSNAFADFNQQTDGGFDVHQAVDGIDKTGWAVWPEVRKNHAAVFDVIERAAPGQATRLTVRLAHRSPFERYLLGRFRLSFTSDPATLLATRLGLDLRLRELVEFYVVLGKTRVRQGQRDAAVAAFRQAHALGDDRAARAAVLAAAASLDGVMEGLAEQGADDARLQLGLARHFADRGQAAQAQAARTKAQARLKQQCEANPDDAEAAHALAELELTEATGWTIVRPVEVTSQGGETFTVEEDGSVFVTGPNPERAVYSLKIRTDLPKVAAIRLQTIPDPRLPRGGAGRADNGNFHVSEFSAAVVPAVAGGPATPLPIARAIAYDSPSGGVANSIDGNPQSRWDTYPAIAEPHTVIFSLKSPAALDGGFLNLTLDSGISPWGKHGLGRFRLSVIGDPADLKLEVKRLAALRRSDPWAKLAAVYALRGDHAALGRVLERHPAAAVAIGDLHAADQEWDEALVQYNKAITPETRDDSIFAARAEAHEKLERWERAAEDWGAADRVAFDKQKRYGNPDFPSLERQLHIYERLGQNEKQVVALTGMLKPDRMGNNAWFSMKRGQVYDRLHDWDRARADYDHALTVCAAAERGSYAFFRALHFAAQGRWTQAADDVRHADKNRTAMLGEWWAVRNAALVFAMAGDVEPGRKRAADGYATRTTGSLDPDRVRWIVLPMLLFPGGITSDNRSQLLEFAAKSDGYWAPRLAASIHCRAGDYQKAAEWFDANDAGGPQFLFIAAMTYQKLGRHDRAKQMRADGDSWVRKTRAGSPDRAIPSPYSWEDWATVIALQFEAADAILGPVAGSPRSLMVRGQTALAAEAYAKALADAPDEEARGRITDELLEFREVQPFVLVNAPDDPGVNEVGRRLLSQIAGPNTGTCLAIIDALKLHRLGEKDEARGKYRQAAAGIQTTSLNPLVRPLVQDAVRTFGPDGPEAALLLAALAGEPPAELARAIQDHPDRAAGYLARGNWYGCRGAWRKADDDYAAAYRLEPDVMTGMTLGILLASVGESERYREHCEKLVGRVAKTSDSLEAERTLKACCLRGPRPIGDPAQVARLADVAVTGDNSQPVFVWLDLARALYEYRVGQFDAAVTRSRANRTRIQGVEASDAAATAVMIVEAMSLKRTGDTAGALNGLAEAKQRLEAMFLPQLGAAMGLDWQNWLAAQMLYREAETLMETREPAR